MGYHSRLRYQMAISFIEDGSEYCISEWFQGDNPRSSPPNDTDEEKTDRDHGLPSGVARTDR